MSHGLWVIIYDYFILLKRFLSSLWTRLGPNFFTYNMGSKIAFETNQPDLTHFDMFNPSLTSDDFLRPDVSLIRRFDPSLTSSDFKGHYFRPKNCRSRHYVVFWISKCIIRVSPTMGKYQKMPKNWVISSLICIKIEHKIVHFWRLGPDTLKNDFFKNFYFIKISTSNTLISVGTRGTTP